MNDEELKDRKGKFAISLDIIDSGSRFALAIMSQVVIVRAEAIHHAGVIEYHAYSEHFRKIPWGEIIPTYKIVVNVTYDDDGKETAIKLAFNETDEPGPAFSRDQLVKDLNAPGRWTGPACLGPADAVADNARYMKAKQLVAAALGVAIADVLEVEVDAALPGTVQAYVKELGAVGGAVWKRIPLPVEDWQQCIGEPPPSKL